MTSLSYPRLIECLSFAAERADPQRAPSLFAAARYWVDLRRDLALCLGRQPGLDDEDEGYGGGATIVDQAQSGIARCLFCGRDEDQCGQLLACVVADAAELEAEDVATGSNAQLCEVCATFATGLLRGPGRDLDRPVGYALCQALCDSLEGQEALGEDGPGAAQLVVSASESFGYFVPAPRVDGICTLHGVEIPGWHVVGRLGALCEACALAAMASHDALRVNL